MILRVFKYFDWPLFSSVIILALLGLMMIYSTGLSSPDADSRLWVKQAIFLLAGLGVFFFLASLDYHYFQKVSTPLYLLALLLLVLVLIFGLEVRGSTRWFDLGLFNFQPAELSKLALLVVLAKYFQKTHGLVQKFRYVLWSAVYFILPAGLILMQSDLGSAAVHGAVWLGMLLISPMPRRYFLYLLVIFLAVSAISWQFVLQDYQRDRVHSFIDPASDPLGRGYNVLQSIVAVGSGGWTGQGLARGLQSQLRFLPERQTDFIFASTVEELGFAGGALILALFGFLLHRQIRIFRKARDEFGTYLAAGTTFLFFFQIVVNAGMNVGLIPVTGITLPFVSYGGSSLLVSFALLGIQENIARHTQRGA